MTHNVDRAKIIIIKKRQLSHKIMNSVMFLLYYLTYKAIITCSFHLTNDIKQKKNEIKKKHYLLHLIINLLQRLDNLR